LIVALAIVPPIKGATLQCGGRKLPAYLLDDIGQGLAGARAQRETANDLAAVKKA
jgi:hypothetical protein